MLPQSDYAVPIYRVLVYRSILKTYFTLDTWETFHHDSLKNTRRSWRNISSVIHSWLIYLIVKLIACCIIIFKHIGSIIKHIGSMRQTFWEDRIFRDKIIETKFKKLLKIKLLFIHENECFYYLWLYIIINNFGNIKMNM